MFVSASHKYQHATMMLMRQHGEGGAIFLGTAFICHSEGFLLTVKHLYGDNPDDLVVVPARSTDEYQTIVREEVAPLPVRVVAEDPGSDVALLRFEPALTFQTPDHLIGNSETLAIGASVLSLGFPFGNQRLHSLAAVSSIVSSKVIMPKGYQEILIDSRVHMGDRGGPVISVEDERIVGLVWGRFCPMRDGSDIRGAMCEGAMDTNISAVVPIEYGVSLMEEQGLEIF